MDSDRKPSKTVTYTATLPDGKVVTAKSNLDPDGKVWLGAWFYLGEWRPGSITKKVVEVDGKPRPIYGYGSVPAEGQVAVEATPIH